MTSFGQFFVIFILTLEFVAASSKKPQTSTSENWPESMQKMANHINSLAPYVFDKNAFSKPTNQKKIQAEIQKLVKASHKIPKKMGTEMYGSDPLFAVNIDNLRDDFKRASESFQMGNHEYSRSILKGTIGHCFRCHSRTSEGREFGLDEKKNKELNLNFIEKAELLVATRRFDRAIQLLEKELLNTTAFGRQLFEQDRALKKYLALMVRVKRNPLKASLFLEKYAKRKDLPFYLKGYISEWRSELAMISSLEPAKKRLIKDAKKLIARATKDINPEVHYITLLRASDLLHLSLKDLKNKKEKATVYKLLGTCYENLPDLGIWGLAEEYYEHCVTTLPKTKTAKQCYKKFEQNLLLGYSGSAGLFLPPDEKDRLKRLKKLAGH